MGLISVPGGCRAVPGSGPAHLRLRLLLLLLLGALRPIVEGVEFNPAIGDTLADGNPNNIARNSAPKDCSFFGWSAWTDCLGRGAFGVPTGIHTRMRTVRSPEKGTTGKPCVTPMFDAALCLTSTGVVDSNTPTGNSGLTGAIGSGAEKVDPTTLTPCTLQEWGMWSGCMSEPDPANAGTQSCGYSYETRARLPSNPPCLISDQAGPAPLGGSSGYDQQGQVRSALLDCDQDGTGAIRGCMSKTSDKGSMLESRLCPIGLCNSDCQVSAWSDYGACSKTCGTGSQRRKRSVSQSAGGSGLPCPHLVESRNCRVQDCNVDCKVGDFSTWGRCLPVAATSTKAVVSAQSGATSSSSCARKRSRPVLTQRAGTGASCPSLQEFNNCPCPFGAGAAVLGLQSAAGKLGNITSLGSGGGGFGKTLQGWLAVFNMTAFKNQYLTLYQRVLTKGKQLGLSWWTLLACAIAACALFICLCGSCCFFLSRCCGKKKRRKVANDIEGDRGKQKNGKGDRYTDGARFQEREANEEDGSDDRTSLLSERPPPPAASGGMEANRDRDFRMQFPPPYEARDRDYRTPQPSYEASLASQPSSWQDAARQPSSWQEAALMYGPGSGGMTQSNSGYPAAIGGMPQGSYPGSQGSYPGSQGSYQGIREQSSMADYGSPSPYGYIGGGGYGTAVGGGYNGRFVDNAPYGGLLEPPRPPGGAGYTDLRAGSLADYAPQPLHNPPPQYYRDQAYSRGPALY